MFFLTEDQVNGKLKEVKDDRLGVTPRRLLQVIGTELFRDNLSIHMPDLKLEGEKLDSPSSKALATKTVWLWHLENRIRILQKSSIENKKNIVVSDIRFEDEAESIKRLGGTIILIHREAEKHQQSESDENEMLHSSEILNISKNIVDEEIWNDGSLQDLKIKINMLHIFD